MFYLMKSFVAEEELKVPHGCKPDHSRRDSSRPMHKWNEAQRAMAVFRKATAQQDKSRTGRMAGFAAQKDAGKEVGKEVGTINSGIAVPSVFYIMHVRHAEKLVPLNEHGALMPQMLYVDEKVVLTIAVFTKSHQTQRKSAMSPEVADAALTTTIHVLEASEETGLSGIRRRHVTPESQARVVHLRNRKRLDGIFHLQVVTFTASIQGLFKKKNTHV